jgi:hypothetical protein
MSAEAHSHEYTVIVNGRPTRVETARLFYDQVVQLAYGDNPPSGDNIEITVSWRHGNKSGTLVEGGPSVDVQDGMKFDVTPTDKS